MHFLRLKRKPTDEYRVNTNQQELIVPKPIGPKPRESIFNYNTYGLDDQFTNYRITSSRCLLLEIKNRAT